MAGWPRLPLRLPGSQRDKRFCRRLSTSCDLVTPVGSKQPTGATLRPTLLSAVFSPGGIRVYWEVRVRHDRFIGATQIVRNTHGSFAQWGRVHRFVSDVPDGTGITSAPRSLQAITGATLRLLDCGSSIFRTPDDFREAGRRSLGCCVGRFASCSATWREFGLECPSAQERT